MSRCPEIFVIHGGLSASFGMSQYQSRSLRRMARIKVRRRVNGRQVSQAALARERAALDAGLRWIDPRYEARTFFDRVRAGMVWMHGSSWGTFDDLALVCDEPRKQFVVYPNGPQARAGEV